MSCDYCQLPVVAPRHGIDVLDHGAVHEPFLTWRPFVLLMVTAFSSYLH